MSKLIFTLICLSAFGGAIPCQAKIIYVDDDGPADLNNIQAGIDAAKDEDTVVVADGTYTGDGNRDIDFLGKAIIVRSENGPEKCIIDCEERGRGFDFHNNEDTNSVVDGFTITHGHGNGGGIACHSNSSPTINNCIITGNWATGSGGGISCYSSSTITNCIITGNYACWDAGGGISCGGNTTVSNCTINSNTAHYIGGGIYCGSGNPTIINSTISGNRAGCGGGSACNATDSILTLINCTISGNSGGGICCIYSNFKITNCILWDDMPEEIYLLNGSVMVTYSDVRGYWPGVGNISTNPQFVDPGHWQDDPPTGTWVGGNYHLKSQAGRWDVNEGRWTKDKVTSLCIDAGDPSSPIGYEPFPNGGIINMGAYGGTIEASKSYFGKPPCETIIAGDINGDCKVDFKDFALMAFHWLEEHQ